ncbi:MAG: ATP-binding protein [Candidatus Thermoplasmatota archaeon]|nr:ATP-binding protein [Candidatus Thermoplasmatota archaeon]
MIISIASGKGGTGKTTVATNFALSLENVQFIDCDVEEPNANFFLNAKIEKRENVVVAIPEINEGKCNHCGKCSDFCAYNALAVVPTKVLVFPELCHSCGGCELVCPKDAIGWINKTIGTVEYGKVDGIEFHQGMLNIGEVQAVPVIKELKKKINRDKTVIIDSPPGTSCPVIESIDESDYCILVTEPTPFGVHDLKLAVDVLRHLYIPFGVIINRDGIGDKKVELYCQQEKIPILLKIPHSKEIAQMYSKGTPFIKKLSLWRDEFQKLFARINEEVYK